MTDPTTTLPVAQALDPWKETNEKTPEIEEKPEVAEATFEVFFDQTDLVSDQATEYWQEHVLKREFESDEKIFVFNNRTYQERTVIVDRLEKDIGEWTGKIGQETESDEQQKIKQKIVAIRELRSQIIMEQAWSDVAYLHSHRAKIEVETRDLAVNAQNQTDIEKLKKIAEKSSHLADRLTKFSLYSESAINLFKKYRVLSPDIVEFTGGYHIGVEYGQLVPGLADLEEVPPNQRYDSVMNKLLLSVEAATGHNFETESGGDRDYLTSFEEMREGVLTIDYKRFVVLIAARVKQLEVEFSKQSHTEESQTATAPLDSTEPGLIPSSPDDVLSDKPIQAEKNGSADNIASALGLSFSDILNNHQEAIAEQTKNLDDPDKVVTDAASPDNENTAATTVTEVPAPDAATTLDDVKTSDAAGHAPEPDSKPEKNKLQEKRQAYIIGEMNAIFKGSRG